MKITFVGNNQIYTYNKGTSLLEISKDFESEYNSKIVAAYVDNKLRELTFKPDNDCTVDFVDLSKEDGERIYVRSLSCVFVRAVREVINNCRISIEHSLGNGIYCEILGDRTISRHDVKIIKDKMKEIIDNDEPFLKESVPLKKAIESFKKDKQFDKVRLLKYRKDSHINIYSCGWYKDYFYGYMLPSTGYLKEFDLIHYPPGVIMMFPNTDSPTKVPMYSDQPKMAKIFKESERWNKILGVVDVGSLNNSISKGQGKELILTAEALHEKKIAQIADSICEDIENIRVILVAGPSSSGKTTFAQRLSTQLRVNGLRPISISLDDYFVDREFTPIDEDGNYDFECIDAVDVELFNQHLIELLEGHQVETPIYNFHTGSRENKGNMLKIEKDQPIIVEGIHGLNDRVASPIFRKYKFKIYISALTQLNIDDHNRIPTTDTRILRRMVRDSEFRSSDPINTIKMWPSVRRGEEKYIFPYQEEADAMFNSALIYELAILKRYAEPLLEKVDSSNKEFPKAHTLLKFLSYFMPLDCEDVIPPNSIIREFIGGSCFHGDNY
ncbi:MAG TPA: nucleoside kinase [Thermoanaerobacterales bacterium]|nr:nucleoside kinase [Thermoanaerobacterales bacterium]